MAIPKVFHALKPNDFTMRSIIVNKKFVIQRSDLYSGSAPQTGSGYRIWEGLYIGEKLKINSSIYPTNSFDGTYKHIVWKSIDTQFYRFPHDPQATLEHSNKRFTYKHLDLTASILAIPYMDFGESILPGSIEITGSGFNLTDDKNGNLYDVSLSTGSYSDRHNLIGYWGFNDLVRKCKNIPQDFEKTKIDFVSGIFNSDEGSVGKSVTFDRGVLLNGTSSGLCCKFDESVIITQNRDEFNFTKQDDFTISFWLKYEPHGTDPVNSIISKNTIITEQVYGNLDKYNQNDLIQKSWYVSQSTEYKPVDIYPFRFEVSTLSGVMNFKRSDGKKIINLSGSIDLDDSTWHHYATVKSGSNLYLYQDGVFVQSGSDVDYNPHNKYSILFGNDSLDSTNPFLGSLDEIRIYNKGLSSETISTLADNSTMGMYQTSIVGNAFYRSGNIVISSLNPKYNKAFQNNFTIKYRGTHTIYQYEILCRIKKGDFNLTLNPTVRQSPFSDLLINEMTGSLVQGACFPYFHTVGLYSDQRELLAVGKLSQPIQSRDDVDINLIISFHA